MMTLNCRGKLLSLAKPVVMGILNLTPDSFFEGNLRSGEQEIKDKVGHMLADGAAIIDVGGQSTRPGSNRVSAREELDRVVPPLAGLVKSFPDAVFSIDTYYAEVANAAVGEGASIINDISAGTMDEKMIGTAASAKVPYVAMHIKGTPETMQRHPVYKDVIVDVLDFLSKKIYECREAGIHDVIVDPGFGFGKGTADNYKLLNNLHVFKYTDCPILVGLSRKGMIYKVLETDAAQALNGTSALNMIALTQGAGILRVHDVKEAVECIRLWEQLSENP